MYAYVPAISRSASSSATVTPKSSSTTRPLASILIFDGLTSRWMSPAPCRPASPSATPRIAARRRASSNTGGGRCDGGGGTGCTAAEESPSVRVMSARRAAARAAAGSAVVAGFESSAAARAGGAGAPTQSRKSTPATSSIVKNQPPSRSISSPSRTRLGWRTLHITRNSRLRRSSSAGFTSWSTLRATSPPRWRSRAR